MSFIKKVNNQKIILGITGNIGGGKTAVAKIFEKLGAARFSSDDLAKYYTSAESPIKVELVGKLGEEILDSNDILDRKKIAGIVFKDKSKLEILNKIIHPLVLSDFQKRANLIQKGIIAWEVPLLFETGSDKLCDYTLTVYSADPVALKRVRAREVKLTEEDYKARCDAQLSVKEKLKYSDFNIENNGSLEDLQIKTEAIYAEVKSKLKERQ